MPEVASKYLKDVKYNVGPVEPVPKLEYKCKATCLHTKPNGIQAKHHCRSVEDHTDKHRCVCGLVFDSKGAN